MEVLRHYFHISLKNINSVYSTGYSIFFPVLFSRRLPFSVSRGLFGCQLVLVAGILLLTSCAYQAFTLSSDSKGGFNPPGFIQEAKILSHSAYNFKIANINMTIGADVYLPVNLILDRTFIRHEIAKFGGITDKHQILALSEISGNYSLTGIRIVDDDPSSALNTFFKAERSGENPDLIQIRFLNPTGVNLDTETIFSELISPQDNGVSFELELELSSPLLAKNEFKKVRYRTEVNLTLGDDPDISTILSFDLAQVLSRPASGIELSYSMSLMENSLDINFTNPAMADLNNLIAYGLSLDGLRERSLFFSLRNQLSNRNATDAIHCSINNDAAYPVYIDNDDYRIKTFYSYDYERGDTPPRVKNCSLAVSSDGLNYFWLALPVKNTTAAVIERDKVKLDDYPMMKSAGIVSDSKTSVTTCINNGYDCYHVFVDIRIEDVDEHPIIELVKNLGSSTDIHLAPVGGNSFFGSYEGVGVKDSIRFPNPVNLIGNLTEGGIHFRGHNLPSLFSDAYGLRISDSDYDSADKTRRREVFNSAADYSVESVIPGHGKKIFSLARLDNDLHWFILAIDDSLLDFERFSAEELTGNGKAIYNITIRAVDDGGRVTRRSFNYEVRDVVYRPVEEPGFTKSGNIFTENNHLYLLSGILPFSTRQHHIGNYKVVDPETENDENIVYSFIATNAGDPSNLAVNEVFRDNFSLLKDNGAETNYGGKLIISNSGLRNTIEGEISLMAIHKSLLADFHNKGLTNNREKTLAAARKYLAENKQDPRALSVLSFIVQDYQAQRTATSNSDIRFKEDALQASLRENADPSYDIVYEGGAGTLDFYLDRDSIRGRSPTFGFVPDAFIDDIFPDLTSELSSLLEDLKSDPDNFVIEPNTGAINIKPNVKLDFNTAPIYRLPIYVSASPSVTNYKELNMLLLKVTVQDINQAPQFSNYVSTKSPITFLDTTTIGLNLPETLATAEILRFSVDDDNDDWLSLEAGSTDSDFELELEEGDDGRTTAIVRLTKKLDYESFPDNDLSFSLQIRDKGVYTYDSSTELRHPANSEGGLTSSLNINIRIIDVPETPLLAINTKSQGEISENAPLGALVSGLNMAITNVNELRETGGNFKPSRFAFDIKGPLSGIIGAEIFPPGNSEQAAIQLFVRDPLRLENLGDGRNFPLGLSLRDSATGLVSEEMSLLIRIVDAPINSDLTNGLAVFLPDQLNLNEHDVEGDNNYRFPDFPEIHPIDIIPDADDTLFGIRPAYGIVFSVEKQNVANNFGGESRNHLVSPGLINPNLLKLSLASVNSRQRQFLSIADPDFVEKRLFGDLEFNLVARDTYDQSNVGEKAIKVKLSEARNKDVFYAPYPIDGQVKSRTPGGAVPVYGFRYTQTDYADPFYAYLGPFGDDLVSYRDVIGGTDKDIDYILLDNGDVHDVLDVIGYGRFINRKSRNNFELKIPIISKNYIITSYDVLVENNDGDLVPVPNLSNLLFGFYDYFDIEIDNTVDPQVIEISQKRYAANFTQGKAAPDYNALDTIPLFSNGEERRTLNYYIRVVADHRDSDASFYALAQLNVEVESAGLDRPTVVVDAALVADGSKDFNKSFARFDRANDGWHLDLYENGANQDGKPGDLSAALNNFDHYDILIKLQNPDGYDPIDGNEGRSRITLSLAEGNTTGLGDTQVGFAGDSNLISIKLPDSNSPPSAGARIIHTLSEEVAGFINEQSENYTLALDFALARNLHGSAKIVLEVEDRETDGTVLERSLTNIHIHVADLPFKIPRPKIGVGGDVGTAGAIDISLNTLAEDNYPPPNDKTKVGIAFDLNSSIENPVGKRAKIKLVGIDNTPANTSGQNPRGKKFLGGFRHSPLDQGDAEVYYDEHGWGVQRLQYELTIEEPRGFVRASDPGFSYTITYSQFINVTSAPDEIQLVSFTGFRGFQASDFLGSQPRIMRSSGALLFRDPDLIYGFNNTGVSGRVKIIPDDPELVFSPTTYDLTPVAGNDALAMSSAISYSLTLSPVEARQKQDKVYRLGFDFDKNGAGIDMSPSARAQVLFTSIANDAEIVDNGDQAFSAMGMASIVEESAAGIEIGNLSIRDYDIAKGKAFHQAFTFGFVDAMNNFLAADPHGLVKWDDSGAVFKPGESQAGHKLILARDVDDEDVSFYNISWGVQDRVSNTSRILSGGIHLTITRVEDDPTALNITFGSGRLNRQRDKETKIHLANFSYRDNDFAEKYPTVNLEKASYESLTFGFSSSLLGNYTCALNSMSDFVAAADLANQTITRKGIPGVSLSGNLQFDAMPIDLSMIRRLSACPEATIGTRLSSVGFNGIKVKNSGDGAMTHNGFGDRNIKLDPGYVITGYRTEPVELQLNLSGTITDGEGNISFNVGTEGIQRVDLLLIDNDKDDGVADAPSPPHSERTNTGLLWGGARVIDDSNCAALGVSAVVGGGYISRGDGLSSLPINLAYYPAQSMGGRGTCAISIIDGEDGQRDSINIGIKVELPPTINITNLDNSIRFDSREEYMKGINLGIELGDGDPYDDDRPNLILKSENSNLCDFGGKDKIILNPPAAAFLNSVANLNITITAKLPGPVPCAIIMEAKEDQTSSGIVNVSLAMDQVSPLLGSDGYIYHTLETGSIAAPVIGSISTQEGNSVGIQINVSNQDIAVAPYEVEIEIIGSPSECSAKLVGGRMATGDKNIYIYSSHSPYIANLNISVEKNGYGYCGTGNLSLTAIENEARSIPYIVPQVDNIYFVPRNRAPMVRANFDAKFSSYGDKYIVEARVGENDGFDDLTPNNNKMDISFISESPDVCGFSSGTRWIHPPHHPSAGEGMEGAVVNFRSDDIMLYRPGECRVRVDVVEAGHSNSSLAILGVPQAAPIVGPITGPGGITSYTVNRMYDYARPIILQAQVFDGDVAIDGRPNIMLGNIGDSCVINSYNITGFDSISNSAWARVRVTPVLPGTCIVEINATEDGILGRKTFVMEQRYVPPLINITRLIPNVIERRSDYDPGAIMGTATVTDRDRPNAARVSINLTIADPSVCSVYSPLSPLDFQGGFEANASFNLTALKAGEICVVTASVHKPNHPDLFAAGGTDHAGIMLEHVMPKIEVLDYPKRVKEGNLLRITLNITSQDPGDNSPVRIQVAENLADCFVELVGGVNNLIDLAYVENLEGGYGNVRTDLLVGRDDSLSGNCGGGSISITATEDGKQTTRLAPGIGQVRYAPIPLAPTMLRASNLTFGGYRDTYKFRAWVRSNDFSFGLPDEDKITVTYAALTPNICGFGAGNVASATHPGVDRGGIVSIESPAVDIRDVGICAINITATEAGLFDGSFALGYIIFPQLVPRVEPINGDSQQAYFQDSIPISLSFTKNDPGSNKTFDIRVRDNSRDCDINFGNIRFEEESTAPSHYQTIRADYGDTSIGTSVNISFDISREDRSPGECQGDFNFAAGRGELFSAWTSIDLSLFSFGPIFDTPTMGVTSGLRPRTADIRIRSIPQGVSVYLADTKHSGCYLQHPPAQIGSDIIFTFAQKPGSVGTDSCKDITIHSANPDSSQGNISFGLTRIGSLSSIWTYQDYTDFAGSFAEAEVSLTLNSDNPYNLIESLNVSNGAFQDADGISGNHIYSYLEGRRWYFGMEGILSAYITANNSRGSLNDPVLGKSWTAYFYNRAFDPQISDLFFINLEEYQMSYSERIYYDKDNRGASLASAGYDHQFFTGIKNYNLAAYLKFSSKDYEKRHQPSSSVYQGITNNTGYFTRTFSTSPASPLMTIGTSSTNKNFGLKSRFCHFGDLIINPSYSLLNKPISCDISAATIFTSLNASKVISLGSWSEDDRLDPLLCRAIHGELVGTEGTDHCVIGEPEGIVNQTHYVPNTPLNFQHYIGIAHDHAYPYSLIHSGFYLAEIYPVASQDSTALLGSPLRVLFEVGVQDSVPDEQDSVPDLRDSSTGDYNNATAGPVGVPDG